MTKYEKHSLINRSTIVVLAVLIVIVTMHLAGVAYAATVSLPQTGQTTSYNANTPQRDNGALQIGVAWPNPRFTANSDQTVTDNLTGLVWTKDAATPTVGSCTGGTKTWQGALDYVACLNTANYLGHNDWRLPNINELESLHNVQQSNIANWLISQGFSNVRNSGGDYWSSTTINSMTSRAWNVRMDDGYVGGVDTGKMGYYHLSVWPVRSGQATTPTPTPTPNSGRAFALRHQDGYGQWDHQDLSGGTQV